MPKDDRMVMCREIFFRHFGGCEIPTRPSR
jgi:hypothetical protein